MFNELIMLLMFCHNVYLFLIKTQNFQRYLNKE